MRYRRYFRRSENLRFLLGFFFSFFNLGAMEQTVNDLHYSSCYPRIGIQDAFSTEVFLRHSNGMVNSYTLVTVRQIRTSPNRIVLSVARAGFQLFQRPVRELFWRPSPLQLLKHIIHVSCDAVDLKVSFYSLEFT